MPSGDLAENPYWKRDVRRQYPQLSVVKQADVVALLSVGSAAAPKEDVLQIGDAGNKQIVAVKEEGEKGLSAFFEKEKSAFKAVLGPNGMPPLPASRHETGKRYEMLSEQPYGARYVLDTLIRFAKTLANAQTATPAEHLNETLLELQSSTGVALVYIGIDNIISMLTRLASHTF